MDSISGKSGDRCRALFATVGLGMALLAGGCAVMETTASSYNSPPPGTTYLKAENNTGSFGTGSREVKITVGASTWNGLDVVTFSTSQGANVFSKNGRLVAIVNPANKPIVTWDPPEGGHGLRFPLEVGKTWNETASMRMPDGKVVPHENACSVESREEITVPAGTFMTFKLHCTSPRGLEVTQWYAPGSGLYIKQIQKRAANNPFGGAGTREEHVVSLDLKR
jgi:hypothetical protein